MYVISLVPWIAVMLLNLQVSPASAGRRTCFCDIVKNTRRSPGGSVFHDVPNIIYRGLAWVRCSRVTENCAHDCLNNVETFLDTARTVEPLDATAGTRACQELKEQRTPNNPYYLYARHTPSNCGDTDYNYLGALCCWEYITRSNGRKTYVHNYDCEEDTKPPMISGCS